MDKRQAKQILDRVRDGERLPLHLVNEALRTTGDLEPPAWHGFLENFILPLIVVLAFAAVVIGLL